MSQDTIELRVAARIKRITRDKSSDTAFTLTLEGLARVRLPRSLPPVLSILPGVPLYSTTYSLPLPVLHSPTAPDLWTPASGLLPPQLHEKMKELPVGLLSDVLATVLGFDWELRVELLGLVEVDERAERVREALELMLLKKEGGTVIRRDPKVPPPTPSRALVKRNPPQALGGQVPEDLQPLHALLSLRTPELTGSAYLVISRELTRLVKIPPQSAEYGVGKTYLELLLSLPWRKVTADEGVGLEVARQRLEEEHEGLEEVKRRVVEYLAVYR